LASRALICAMQACDESRRTQSYPLHLGIELALILIVPDLLATQGTRMNRHDAIIIGTLRSGAFACRVIRQHGMRMAVIELGHTHR